MGSDERLKWLIPIVAAAAAAFAAMSIYRWRERFKELESKVEELQNALESSTEKSAAERQGRIRAQQALRKALAQHKSENLEQSSYPMMPIGTVQSCFSTRNGTPRQPLVVPLARACLMFNPSRVPPASLEGLTEYSHCWIIYVFHLNTDLDKLWKEPSRSKFKAKVRVPRLKGGRMGVFATRTPHRPCPIGLTVAKVEAVQGNMVLLSGVDLVDGTPVLDIKPYLPYCDSITEATVPKWVMEDGMLAVTSINFSEGFASSLDDCWRRMVSFWVSDQTVIELHQLHHSIPSFSFPLQGKKSLYSSAAELRRLIEEVLSWDIRSVSQRNQPHDGATELPSIAASPDEEFSEQHNHEDDDIDPVGSGGIVYHLLLEGVDIAYRIDDNSNVIVEKAVVKPSDGNDSVPNGDRRNRSSYSMWVDNLG
ncbi:unnamed protein product [Linum tenue]|uniref:TsaA-like domain-containing protein n=1 Tax=Linum tenue TaxID=586396 RepID=A0AAV0IBG3_9ROSI|nr:unnamed protein product [Linum tenue]